MNRQYTKKIALVSIIFIFLVMALWATPIVNRAGKTKITIAVAPSIAEIKIDGVKQKGNIFYLSKSQHVFEISLKNFYTITQKIDLQRSGSRSINFALDPSNKDGKEFLAQNAEYQRQRESIASNEFAKRGEQAASKYPWLDQLPLERQRFVVTYGDSYRSKSTANSPSIALYVDGISPLDRRTAVYYISKELGIDPSSIEIVFINSSNPFIEGSESE